MDNNKKIIAAGFLFGAFLLSRKKSSIPIINNVVDQLEHSSTQNYSTRNLSEIDKIILHHTATSSGTPQAIAHHHVKCTGSGRCWPGIGYHFVIEKDGTIYQTNYLETISYHTQGTNSTGISVCIVGNYDLEQPTAASIESLNKLNIYLRSVLGKNLPVDQHRDFANKSCPGQNLYNYPETGILNTVGYIYKDESENLTPCKDGTFSSNTGKGTCKGHKGILTRLSQVTDTDLETYFYKDYYIADLLTKTKFSPSSWRRYGDSQLTKEKFMFLKDNGAEIDTEAQSLSWQIGVEVTPQDIIDIILITDNPYTFLDELREEVLQMQEQELRAHGVGALPKKWHTRKLF